MRFNHTGSGLSKKNLSVPSSVKLINMIILPFSYIRKQLRGLKRKVLVIRTIFS